MAKGGVNIGRARVKVVFLDHSPFSAMPRQEAFTYYTTDTFKTLVQTHAFPVPAPLNGLRIMEVFAPYDNFIEDRDGNALENSYLEQKNKVYNEGTGKQEDVTSRSLADPTAWHRYRVFEYKTQAQIDADKTRTANAQAAANATTAESATQATADQIPKDTTDPKQKEFFTWRCCDNLFKQGSGKTTTTTATSPGDVTTTTTTTTAATNPPPPLFTKPTIPSQPTWTYIAMPIPGGVRPIIIMPFMDSKPENDTSPVHWGCRTKTAIAQNQPFEVIWYTCTRDPVPAKDAKPLEPTFNYFDGTNLLDMKLTSAIYVAVEIGRGSKDNYLFVFKNNEEPYLFKMVGNDKERRAQLLARFDGFNAAKLFDRNTKYFTMSIEPVIGNFIVRSNAFSDTPWIIQASPNTPLIIGAGSLGVYSGNISAGFAMRPLQYYPQATFETPGYGFDILYKNGEATQTPTISPTLKGDGEIEQDKNFQKPSSSGKQQSKIYMVDAEKVNGESIKKVAEAAAERPTEDASTMREVKLEIKEITDDSKAPKNPGNYRVSTKNFKAVGTLKASDVVQGNGYKVTNGRSSYLFMSRMELPGDEGEDPVEKLDISCDVMSVDLNWNATSYNELSHNGNIKVLNNKQNGRDYKEFSNRATYVKIGGYWDNGGEGEEVLMKSQPDFWLFEGIIVDATVTIEAHRETITFKVEDYMNALQGFKFNLCPPYDGMKATLAVRDIIRNVGLPDKNILADGAIAKDADLKNDFGLTFTNPPAEPQFLFKNGSSLKEGVTKIAQIDMKTVYFDQYGRFHYDTIPGGLYANRSFTPKTKFFTSPLKGQRPDGGNDFTPGNQAFNQVSFSRLINDVFNQIRLRTVTKRSQNQVAVGSTYRAGIYDPTAEGYLGYKKSLFVDEPALGTVDALFRYLYTLRARLFIPPLTTRFETFGRPGIKPLDIVSLDGQFLRIMNMSLRMNASNNEFWMNVEGEWQFSSAVKDATPDVSPPPASKGPST